MICLLSSCWRNLCISITTTVEMRLRSDGQVRDITFSFCTHSFSFVAKKAKKGEVEDVTEKTDATKPKCLQYRVRWQLAEWETSIFPQLRINGQ